MELIKICCEQHGVTISNVGVSRQSVVYGKQYVNTRITNLTVNLLLQMTLTAF